MVGHACTGEVDHGCQAGELTGVEPARPRVPLDLVRRPGPAADEVHDMVPAGAQECRQRAADQTGGTGDGNAL